MRHEALAGFKFDGELAGCNFNLTLIPTASSLLAFRLTLSSSVVEDDVERRFTAGCTLVRTPGSDALNSTDLILERIDLLTPSPLDGACLLLLTDALREWFATAFARRAATELD